VDRGHFQAPFGRQRLDGPQALFQLLQRQSGVQQRAKGHVAGNAGEAIEVGDPRHRRRAWEQTAAHGGDYVKRAAAGQRRHF
jgi:hypothetical protein